MRVQDKRQTGYFIIDNRVFDTHAAQLGPSGWLIYCAIVRAVDRRTRETHPFYTTLTRKLGVSRATIARTIRRCVQLELLEVSRRAGKGSVYTLPDYRGAGPAPAGAIGEDRGEITHVTREPHPSHQGTGNGSLVRRGQFGHETGGGGAPLPDCQQTLINHPDKVAAGDELGVKNATGAALLTAQGVSLGKADHLANLLDVGLVELVIGYWQRCGTRRKPAGPGLLVHICERPAEYGFRLVDDNWTAPRQPLGSHGKPYPFPSQKRELDSVVAEQVKRDRERAAKELADAPGLAAFDTAAARRKLVTARQS